MNKKLLIGILLILLLILVLSFLWRAPQEVIITTDRTEYNLGEAPTMTIKNNLTSNICISSCYPYYLEKNNGEWENYLYEECGEPDLVEMCIEPKQAKGLELIISVTDPGLHRIAVPSCVNCQVGERFGENERFYSNEFTIGR
jgi:hypothetical protein